MIVEWLSQQLASVENTRMKYSGSDFKFTSQANHMQKLLQLKKDYEREGFHLQRLYKRRKKDKYGIMRSTFGTIMNFDRYSENNKVTDIEDNNKDSQQEQQEQVIYDGGGAIFDDIDDPQNEYIIYDGGGSSF